MGYECRTAVADLVDNSVAAHASEIHINIIAKQDSHPAMIVIADNGKGMDKDQLHEAMRFGAFQEYSPTDLGKYGLGLKTASLSQSRTLTVTSRAKASGGTRPRRNSMRWSVDHVYETDEWDLLVPTESEFEDWEREALSHEAAEKNGTVVLWTDLNEALPLLSSDDAREREKFLAQLIEDISAHLSMVFHRFMQGSVTGRRKLNIYVCGEALVPWDPFCRTEKTKELDILGLDVITLDPDGLKAKESITISPFVLPREDEFSTPAAWKAASGPKNWNQQQGLYFYRNNRLLQAGGWSYLRAVDEHTKLLRVAIDFPGVLDRAFQINVTKMKAHIPAEIKDTLSSHVSKWALAARTRYDRRAPLSRSKKTQAATPVSVTVAPPVSIGPITFSQGDKSSRGLVVIKKNGAEKIEISVPQGHDLSAIFTHKGAVDAKKLCMALLGVLETVYDRKISANRIPISLLKKLYKKL